MSFFNSNGWYAIAVLVIGIVSFFTGEMVTFVMLGIIIISLTNIHRVLKEISAKLDRKNNE